MSLEKKQNTLSLYCCGGAGINIGKVFLKYNGEPSPGVAVVEPHYIDTSRSNLTSDLPDECVYTIDGLDGSGKVRAENHIEIAEHVKSILQQFEPKDISVVVSSAGGGSGSVIAPSLVSELLAQGKPVIVMLVGSTATRIELENTMKTIKSYEAISHKRGTPVVAMYAVNPEDSSKNSRTKVNEQIHRGIFLLATLFSGQNSELDTADLSNWLNYNKVTSHEPHLVSLSIHTNAVNIPKSYVPVTVATLTDADSGSNISTETSGVVLVDYQCVGYLPKDAVIDGVKFERPVHFVTVDGAFSETVAQLQTQLASVDKARSARVIRNAIVDKNDTSTDAGIVL